MHGWELLEYIAWRAAIALAVLTTLRLLFSGLYRTYSGLALMLAVSAARSLLLFSFPTNTQMYADLFMYSAPVLWVCWVLAALQAYDHVLRGYSGLAVVGRRTMLVVLGSSVALALLTNLDGIHAQKRFGLTIQAVLRTDKTLALALALFLAGLAAFLLYYPIPIRRNVLFLSFGLCLYFLATGASFLLMQISDNTWLVPASAIAVLAGALVRLAWLLWLTPGGEMEITFQGLPRSKGEQDRLLAQLDALNASLAGGRRK